MKLFWNIFLMLILGLVVFSCGKKTATARVEQPKQQDVRVEDELANQEVTVDDDVPEVVEELEEEVVYLLCELRRSSCYGKCPSYQVKLYSDGKVTYKGKANVERIGEYIAYCEPESFEAIFTAAEQANYFVLRSQYPEDGRRISDLPETITYLKRDGLEKRVVDNFDAPANLVKFENWLDSFFDELEWKVQD